ncbi:hypothetical protein CDD80_6786 [Ophiocordyceps camponoti-rufipedis]|uniref:Uncharacterized protein n=1 Tax=Ophiocordyceps camponoti-rufipedis TaxID=2004952 RepID=A0A2C5XTZ7_9HYPO|nr:hypothetical protein CDD80_6786 [Ophiocordyceps camponoti-rufipedis]
MQRDLLAVKASATQLREGHDSDIDRAWSNLFTTIQQEGDKIAALSASLSESDFDSLRAVLQTYTVTLEEVIVGKPDTADHSIEVVETLKYCGKFRSAAQRASQARMAFSSKLLRKVPEDRMQTARIYTEQWGRLVLLMTERGRAALLQTPTLYPFLRTLYGHLSLPASNIANFNLNLKLPKTGTNA